MNLAPEKSGAFFCPKFPAPTWFGALIPVANLGHSTSYGVPYLHSARSSRFELPTHHNNLSSVFIPYEIYYTKPLDNCFLFACRTELRYAATRRYIYHAPTSYRMNYYNTLITVSSLRAAPPRFHTSMNIWGFHTV